MSRISTGSKYFNRNLFYLGIIVLLILKLSKR